MSKETEDALNRKAELKNGMAGNWASKSDQEPSSSRDVSAGNIKMFITIVIIYCRKNVVHSTKQDAEKRYIMQVSFERVGCYTFSYDENG